MGTSGHLGWLRRLRRRQDGAAGVEFALLLPIFILLTFGITEVGRLLLHHHAIEKSVRSAARYLSRVNDPVAESDKAKSIVLRGSLDDTAPLLLSYFTGTAQTGSNSVIVDKRVVDNAAGDFRGEATLYAIDITAVVPFSSVLLGLLGLPNDIPLQVHHEQRYIGN